MWFSAVYEPQLSVYHHESNLARANEFIGKVSAVEAAVATVHEPKFDITTIMNLSHGRGRQIIFTRFDQSNVTKDIRRNIVADLN